MSVRSRPWSGTVLGSLLLFLGLWSGAFVASPARATDSVTLAFVHGNAWAAQVPVTLYFSAGQVSGSTDRFGRATFPVPGGSGFWVEIEGLRLAKFYHVESVPIVIDLDKVGTMKWRGGKQS